MGRRREHDEHTAERLLDEAERLLDAEGPEAVTVRGVAHAGGLSVRAVYATLSGKDGLIDALVGRAFTQLAERVEAVPETDDPAKDLIRAGVDGFRRFALDHPELYRLTFEHMLLAASGEAAPWAEPGRRAQRALRHFVRRALDAAERPATDLHSAVAQCHAMCQGLASCEVNGVFAAMGVREPERQWNEALSCYAAALVGRPLDTLRDAEGAAAVDDGSVAIIHR